MSYSRHDVALILSGNNWLGTGMLVAPNRILTARHVVFDEHGQEKPDLRVRLEATKHHVTAKVTWPGANDCDVAVLEAEVDRKPPLHPLLGLSSDAIATNTPWEAQGYPAVRDEQASTKLEQVRGRACEFVVGSPNVRLDVDAAPDKFNGLSGGAVIVCRRIVAVMRAAPNNWGGRRLEATPVSAFLDNPAFRSALGLTEHDDELERRIQRMIDDVVAVLVERPHLLDAFSKRLKLQSAPDQRAIDVAHGLVRQRKAFEIARDFNHADADLAKNEQAKDDRAALCKILFRILPLAIDWHELVRIALRDFPDRRKSLRNFIELPLRTETIAEIVLSGIDDRSCQFALPDRGKMPVGAGVVRLPAAARTALIDVDGSRLAECVVQDLATKFAVDQYKHYNDLRDAVEAHLQYHTRDAPEDELVPYYLLFVDGDDGTDDKLFTLARTKLEAELPPLRLVRLTGTNLKDENSFAHHIQGMLKRR